MAINQEKVTDRTRQIPGTEEVFNRYGELIRIPIIPKPSSEPFEILKRPAESYITKTAV